MIFISVFKAQALNWDGQAIVKDETRVIAIIDNANRYFYYIWNIW